MPAHDLGLTPEGSLPPEVPQVYLPLPEFHPHTGLVEHCCFIRVPPWQK